MLVGSSISLLIGCLSSIEPSPFPQRGVLRFLQMAILHEEGERNFSGLAKSCSITCCWVPMWFLRSSRGVMGKVNEADNNP